MSKDSQQLGSIGKDNMYFRRILFGLVFFACNAHSMTLEHGWRGLTSQIDPFDISAVKVTQIYKDSFTFRCGELNVEISRFDYDFDSYSYNRNLKYIVDGNIPVEKTGVLSTYLGGSDLMTDDEYFSFKLNDADLDMFRKGNLLKVAGKGWGGYVTKSLNLDGFTSSYSKMCDL